MDHLCVRRFVFSDPEQASQNRTHRLESVRVLLFQFIALDQVFRLR